MPPVALHQRQEVLLLSSIEVFQRSGGRQLAQFGIFDSHFTWCSAVCVVSHRKARYSVQEINILELDKHQVSTIKNEIITICKKKIHNLCKCFTFVHFHFSSNVRVTAAIQTKNNFSTILNTINTQKNTKAQSYFFFDVTFDMKNMSN